ncbi:MAG: sugar phosphate isomerase/epimerase, partial [Bifidobacteriaceae bacterium]|nr:sugar phosphate isomerase/epimerase [Bifidobacteriaceae bacterium]
MTRNLLGIHALVFAGGTSPAELSATIEETRRAGYDLLEISLHDSPAIDIPAARSALAEARLGLVCSRGLSFDADVSSEDAAVAARGATALFDSLRMTRALGGTFLTGALYSALGKYPRPLSAAGRANAVAALRDVAAEARDAGLTLGLEACNRYETNVVNTAADALRLADAIGADNVCVHLDTYHMNIEEDSLGRAVRLAGDRLGYVHIGENHRGYLGGGHIDFPEFFRALADIGYAGPVVFESFSSAVLAPALTQDLAIWRDLWADGPALARHARAFLRSQLEAA